MRAIDWGEGFWIKSELKWRAEIGHRYGAKPRIRARHEKSALFQWEEDIPPGNCCSSRKQPERELPVTAEREASGAKGPAWLDQRAHRPE